ncbi:MAG: hypothetical protein PVI82_01685 [Desulfobacterales bacterium]|jgi:hypothetical protein
MKQRYFISRDKKTSELTIEEYAAVVGNVKRYEISALAQDDFTLLCTETYEGKMIKRAISQGKEFLVSVLRTDNLYPISIYANIIADSVIELYGKDGNLSRELLFDDLDLLASLQEA